MKTVLLSFDTEEFDVPKEHGVDFSLDEGINVSVEGTNRILDVLKETGVIATFFCTGNFIRKAPDVIKRLLNEGHELACHGVNQEQVAGITMLRTSLSMRSCILSSVSNGSCWVETTIVCTRSG